MISKDTINELSGSNGYAKGWVASRGGSVQPLAYARGLARAATDAGATIHSHTLIKRLSQTGNGWTLQASGAHVKADQVILSTNGYTDGLYPGLRKSIVPIISIQAATEPLSDKHNKMILPQRHTFADTRRVIFYFRKTADQRLVFGTAGFSGEKPAATDIKRIRKGLASVYPFLEDTRIDYLWGGRIAVTQDHLPHIHHPAPGLWTGLGCNGRGVAMATVMGRLLAELALGAEPSELPVPVTTLKSYPLHRFHRLGSKVILHWSELLDRRESSKMSGNPGQEAVRG